MSWFKKTLMASIPPSDAAFRMLCAAHLNKTIAGFESRGATNLSPLKERWFGLLEGELWQGTYKAISDLWKESLSGGRAETQGLVEDGPAGRMLLATVAPCNTEQEFRASLPGGGYPDFLKAHRKAFYELDGWQSREFAHWLFCVEVEVSVSLLYLWSFQSIVNLMMAQHAGLSSAPPPMIVPLEVVGGDAGAARLVDNLLQADAAVSKQGRTGV